jgi:hypothetical protein
MNDMPVSPEQPKKSNTGLIIAVVVVVLLCCCCIGGVGAWWLWNNGDRLMQGASLLVQAIA